MRRRQPDPGAAAVEFALVAPVLFLLLFGIIDYGAWFADQISIRQAAASGARMAAGWSVDDSAVPPWGTLPTPGCTPWDGGPAQVLPSVEIEALGCRIQSSAQPLTGRVYVRIRIIPPDQVGAASPASATGPDTWASPNAVQICLLQAHASLTGFIPLPAPVITARVVMPLNGTSTNGITLVGGSQALPGGLSWTDSCP